MIVGLPSSEEVRKEVFSLPVLHDFLHKSTIDRAVWFIKVVPKTVPLRLRYRLGSGLTKLNEWLAIIIEHHTIENFLIRDCNLGVIFVSQVNFARKWVVGQFSAK